MQRLYIKSHEQDIRAETLYAYVMYEYGNVCTGRPLVGAFFILLFRPISSNVTIAVLYSHANESIGSNQNADLMRKTFSQEIFSALSPTVVLKGPMPLKHWPLLLEKDRKVSFSLIQSRIFGLPFFTDKLKDEDMLECQLQEM